MNNKTNKLNENPDVVYGGLPVKITRGTKQQLYDLGYGKKEVETMRLKDIHEILKNFTTNKKNQKEKKVVENLNETNEQQIKNLNEKLDEKKKELLKKLEELKEIDERKKKAKIAELEEIDRRIDIVSKNGSGENNTDVNSKTIVLENESAQKTKNNTTEPQEPPNKEAEQGIPLSMSRGVKQQLSDLGYTKEDIAQMSLEEAHKIILNFTTKKKDEAVVVAGEAEKEEEKKVKSIREKIFSFFKRKEKEESPHEKTEKEEFRKNMESRLARGEKIENIRDLYLKKIEEKNKRELEEGPLSARLKNNVINALKSWEKFGIEEKNQEGQIVKRGSFYKRMTKMGISVALISVVSMNAVEKLAERGIGTATALTTTSLGKRMFMGVGMGSLIDAGGNKMSPKMKKWIPLAMAGVGAGAALALTGGLAAPAIALTSSGLGYISTKYINGNFTEEKILEREKRAKENFQKKLLNEKGETDINSIYNIEKDYKKILKKYENMRIWGKLLDEGTKIFTGSVISTGVLEASGTISDHNTKIEIDEQKRIDEATTERKTEMDSRSDEMAKAKSEVELQAQQKLEQNTEIIVEKGEGAISMFRDLKESLELKYNNNEEGATPLEKYILENDENKLAMEYKMFQPLEQDESIELHPGDKLVLDTQKQTLTFHESIQNKDFLLQENGKVFSNDYGEKMFDSNGDISEIEKEIVTEEGSEKINPENIPSTTEGNINGDEKIDEVRAEEKSNVIKEKVDPEKVLMEQTQKVYDPKEDLGNKSRGEQIDNNKPIVEPIHDKNTAITTEDIKETIGRMYTQDNLGTEPRQIYDNNLQHIFKTPGQQGYNPINNYNHISNNEANSFLGIIPNEKWVPAYRELHEYVHKLEEISGLKPVTQTDTHQAETINQFMVRAIEKIDQMGKLDKIKL